MTVFSRLRIGSLLGMFAVALTIGGLTGAAYAHHEAAAVTGSAAANLNLAETFATNLTGVKAKVTPSISFSQGYGAGTGTGAIDKKWCDKRTIAASGADTLDLAGVLTNEFGATVTFAKVKALGVKAATGNTNDVWVGGAAANRFNTFVKDSSVIVVKPGFMQLIAGSGTGYAVTAATGDRLLLKNSSSGTSVTLDICIAGTST
jgi:hypothetical protein